MTVVETVAPAAKEQDERHRIVHLTNDRTGPFLALCGARLRGVYRGDWDGRATPDDCVVCLEIAGLS